MIHWGQFFITEIGRGRPVLSWLIYFLGVNLFQDKSFEETIVYVNQNSPVKKRIKFFAWCLTYEQAWVTRCIVQSANCLSSAFITNRVAAAIFSSQQGRRKNLWKIFTVGLFNQSYKTSFTACNGVNQKSIHGIAIAIDSFGNRRRRITAKEFQFFND